MEDAKNVASVESVEQEEQKQRRRRSVRVRSLVLALVMAAIMCVSAFATGEDTSALPSASTGMTAIMGSLDNIGLAVEWAWSMITVNPYMATLMGGGLICLGLRIAGRGKRFARFG